MINNQKIRLAEKTDASAMLAIYAPYVEHTSVTFETALPTVGDFSKRVLAYLRKGPWLVLEMDGQVAGYAYASVYRERIAYQWSMECSVYVSDAFHRRGVAKALYEVLFEIMKKQGFRNVYAVINLPNDSSVALHESMGFNWFATYENVGYKLGKWKNVGWWRLILNDFSEEPEAPVFFEDLDKGFLLSLFEEKSRSFNKKP